MGIRTQLQPPVYHSWFSGRNPIEQCTAFAALAAGGVRRDAAAIARVKTVMAALSTSTRTTPVQAISPAVAAAAILSGVLTSGMVAMPTTRRPSTNQLRWWSTSDAQGPLVLRYTPQCNRSLVWISR